MLSIITTLQLLAQDAGDILAGRLTREDGATAVEYGLLVALIAAVIVAVVAVLGTQIETAFCTVTTAIGGTCP